MNIWVCLGGFVLSLLSALLWHRVYLRGMYVLSFLLLVTAYLADRNVRYLRAAHTRYAIENVKNTIYACRTAGQVITILLAGGWMFFGVLFIYSLFK